MPMDRLDAAFVHFLARSRESEVVMGASDLAAKRAAKASRRKAIVAQKRKAAAAEGTLAGQSDRAAALPVRHCLLSENLFDIGMGSLVLARGSTVGPVVVGAFLLDTFCRGVKDVYLRMIEREQLADHLDLLNEATPLVEVDPSHARKLLGALVEWSGALGIQQHRDFPAVERLFGDVDPQACDAEFVFGRGGKPLFMSGPSESPSLTHRLVEQMRKRLGSDGFDYIVPM
jgi:hypothetical protein